MWCVKRPVEDVKTVFETCISAVRDGGLRARLAGVTKDVVEAASEYELRAAGGELHLIAQHSEVGGSVSKDEMIDIYNIRMAGKNGAGRSIYAALKLLPEHDRCPFCDHRDVSTLDHILPKAFYPVFSVTPDNLVGCCKDCNKAKLSAAPTSAADAALHPYFDNVSSEEWLNAQVVERGVCAVLFNVRPQACWSAELNSRLKKQFEVLGLARLYSQQAAREMSGIRQNLARLFNSRNPGHEAVRQELDYQWRSRQAHRVNSWQAATYRALSQSDWYCREGYRLGA